MHLSGLTWTIMIERHIHESRLLADWTALAPRVDPRYAHKLQAPAHLRAPMARGQRGRRR